LSPLIKERVVAGGVRYVTALGIWLPAAYVIPIVLSRISSQLGRLNVLAWLSDAALLFSAPWVLLGIILIILRARELPQRFWIAFCVNGFLAYMSLPIYMMHFGVYR
jgi:hypothetical protein